MEQKYESDLTKKEKRQLEWEKIKSLGFKQRLVYLWTYYKFVLVFVALGAALCSLLWTSYQNRQTKTILSMVIVDPFYESIDDVEALEAELLELLGTGDKYEKVLIDINTTSAEDDYYAAQKMMVVLMTGGTDLMICNEDVFRGLYAEEAFMSWESVLGDDYEKYEQYITDGYIDFTLSPRWQENYFALYKPACAGVLYGAENYENIKILLDYYFE